MNQLIGTYWIALFVDASNVAYFDSFAVEHIPKEIKKIIGNKNIVINYIQNYNYINLQNTSIRFNNV